MYLKKGSFCYIFVLNLKQNNMKDNILIAEFMGVVFYDDQNEYYDSKEGLFLGKTLKYDVSWDWLMPVVEKIEEITTNVGFKIYKRLCLLQADNNTQLSSINLKSTKKIDHVYDVVTQFIKWNNTQLSYLFEVYSSHGLLTCDKFTGKVKKCKIFEGSETEYLKDVVKVNIDEYLSYHKVMKIPSRVDILDLGTWTKDGEYTSAEEDWRKEMRLSEQ